MAPHGASQPSFTDTHSGKTPYCTREADRADCQKETEVEGYQSDIFIKQPNGRSRQGRAALWRQIRLISAGGKGRPAGVSRNLCSRVPHTATQVLS